MALKEKYKECRANSHTPVDIDTQHNGPAMFVQAVCDTCGAMLEAQIEEWDALWDDEKLCEICEEAPPYCECEGEE